MFNIQTLVVGDLQTNCYLLSSKETLDTIIIDPGDEADFISQTLIDQKLKPTAIILTHGHFDHVLGCLELKLNFDIPILINQRDEKLYNSANQSASHWLKRKTLKVPPIDQFIKENDEIKFGNEKLIVIETPGHTPGSICLLSAFPLSKGESKGVLFTGDTLFADGPGRTDLSYSDPLQLNESITKIKSLRNSPLSTVNYPLTIYPGHDNTANLKDLL